MRPPVALTVAAVCCAAPSSPLPTLHRLDSLPTDPLKKKVAVDAEFFRVSHCRRIHNAAVDPARARLCSADCAFRSLLSVCLPPSPLSQRLRRLLAIVLPNMRCKEFFILFLHTMFLVSRTLVSIYVAKLDGSIVKSIVDRKLKLFIWLMCKWMMIAVRIQTRAGGAALVAAHRWSCSADPTLCPSALTSFRFPPPTSTA